VDAQNVNILDAATVDVTVNAAMENLTITTQTDGAKVQLNLTDAKANQITLNLAGKDDQVSILSAADESVYTIYADRVELKHQATVFVTTTEALTVTGAGAQTTVDIVETPCDLTVNTADGNNTIQIGVVFQEAQTDVSGTAIEDGWLSAGAMHTVTLNTGNGDDLVYLHNATGKIIVSGGEGDDQFHIQQYRYQDSFDKLPIGEFGAYADVETVILHRLVDRYIVVKGDTLTYIAKMFGVTVEKIVEWNSEQISDPNFILPGQELIIGPYNVADEIIIERIA
jgi:nucleoid-associated protein YgaU